MSWERKPLEEVADFALGKMLDLKKNKGSLRKYLANIDVRWGSFDLTGVKEMPFQERELERYGLKYGDIVMCEGGEPGRCAIWKNQVPGMMYQKALHRIRPYECLDSHFLYYYFLRLGKLNGFLGMTTGATIRHLPKEMLAKIEVPVPPLPVQKKIASILSAYDDLIENNRRRIAILEEMARKVYRKRFGGKRGANRVSLRSFVNQTVSGDWGMESSGGRCSERIVCLRGADITSVRQRDWGKRIVRYVTQKHVEERAMRDGDLFVELSGGSPTQATGRVGLVTDEMLRDVDCPVLCTNFCRVVRPKGGYSYFLYLTWLDLYEKDVMFLYEHSAIALKNFDLDLFLDKVTVGNPATEELLKFNEDVKPLMDQMDVLGLANRRLAAARDALLPKLMSGKLEAAV